ncbi:MAG: FkbM family methyltransferase [Rhodobacteraceae bacterium]|nr:FkbM family methyltransferase [Paracoccaceae bacterium]
MGNDIVTHKFANGIVVNQAALDPVQIERYTAENASNLHEPVEECWFSHVFERTGEDGLFVDVGAAIGYYSVLVRRAKPGWSIRAMEPWDQMRGALSETFSLNDLAMDGVTVDVRALSSKDGTTRFRTESFGSGISKSRRLFRKSEIKVQTVDPATLLAEIERPVSLMKIDIQGHEVDVLKAAEAELAKGLVQWIILGTHGPEIHDSCLDILSRSFEIVHDEKEPDEQPDGIIVARFSGSDA